MHAIALLLCLSLHQAPVDAAANSEVDAGVAAVEPAPAPPPPAPTPPAPPKESVLPPPFVSWDFVSTPWGPGRRNAGERFASTATLLPDSPLRWSWNGFQVSLGAQYIARFEGRDNLDLSTAAQDQTLGVDQRARLSMRASAKDFIGLQLDFQDVRPWADPVAGGASTTGLYQGFLDVHVAPWLDVRAGRQELAYGEERVLGAVDWAQAARSFDGLFARVTASKSFTLDAFAMVLKPPAWVTPTGGGNKFHNSGSYLTGLYSRTRIEKSGVDVYALGLFDDPATAATGLSKDNNHVTLGARGFTTIAGLNVIAEGVFQTGKVGPQEALLLAGGGAVRATYTLSQVWGTPYIAAEFTFATPAMQRLFPTAHAVLGYADIVGWQNVVAERGAIGFRPWGAHVWLDVHHFNAWDPKAAWYLASGAVYLAADPNRTAGNMGTELDLSATVPLIPNVALAGSLTVFLPGDEAAAAKGRDVSTWGFLSIRAQL
ncbi:MAG: alginate export family protein [Myxococcaceae bacterium]